MAAAPGCGRRRRCRRTGLLASALPERRSPRVPGADAGPRRARGTERGFTVTVTGVKRFFDEVPPRDGRTDTIGWLPKRGARLRGSGGSRRPARPASPQPSDGAPRRTHPDSRLSQHPAQQERVTPVLPGAEPSMLERATLEFLPPPRSLTPRGCRSGPGAPGSGMPVEGRPHTRRRRACPPRSPPSSSSAPG